MKKLTACMLALVLALCSTCVFAEGNLDFTYAGWVEGFTADGLALFRARNNLYGYVDTKGNIAIPAQFADADSFSEGLACVCVNGRYGYIDTTGKIVIACSWDDAQSFSEGVAAVMSGSVWGFIDTTGAVVIQPAYNSVTQCQNGYIRVGYGADYIDRTGAAVTPVYESGSIFRIDSTVTGGYTKTYKYELRANGHAITTTSLYDTYYAGYSFDLITRVANTESLWIIAERSKSALDSWYSMNYLLYDAMADRILMRGMDYIAPVMSEGMIAVRDDSVAYYVNARGEMVIPPVGMDAHGFADGAALIKVADDMYVFCDVQGNILGSYDYAYDMNNGFSIVREDGKWYVINSRCEKVQ